MVTADLVKDAVMAMVNLVNNRYHRTIWRWMTSMLGRCLACLRWIICCPHPPRRSDHGPVAADSAPQAALDLLTARDMPGKGF